MLRYIAKDGSWQDPASAHKYIYTKIWNEKLPKLTLLDTLSTDVDFGLTELGSTINTINTLKNLANLHNLKILIQSNYNALWDMWDWMAAVNTDT